MWRDQTLDFLTEIVQKPAYVAGNSLGGFTALYAASSPVAKAKELIKGCILLNAAGRFKDPDGRVIEEPEKPQWLQAMQAAIQRFVINVSFIITKQPARIRAVLKQVYPISPEMIDDELVDSIRFPAADDNAAEVFYRVIKKNGNGPAVFVDDLLWTLDDMPLALVWGEKDPWIRPQVADAQGY